MAKKRKLEEVNISDNDESKQEKPPKKKAKKSKKRKKKKEFCVYAVMIERDLNTHDGEKEASLEAIYSSCKEANKHASDLYKRESNGNVDEGATCCDDPFERYDEPEYKYGDCPVHVWVETHTVITKYHKT